VSHDKVRRVSTVYSISYSISLRSGYRYVGVVGGVRALVARLQRVAPLEYLVLGERVAAIHKNVLYHVRYHLQGGASINCAL